MEKNSHHNHNHAESNIVVAFWLNLGFVVIELIGGLLTNSIAILSDALHDLGDSFSLGLSWYFQRVSKKKRDAKYSYGYRRFSLLGALINSGVLLVGSVFVIYKSVERVIDPQQADAKGMFLLAILGIVVNGAAMLRLRRGSSLNERTVSLHLLEDVLGWAAVLVASVVMMFFDVPILDPILSLAIACYILFNIYRNLRDTLRVVLQGTPEDVDSEQVEKLLTAIPEIESIHDLHLWTMDGEYNIMTVHLVCSPDDLESVVCLKQKIKKSLKGLNIHHATIEIDRLGEVCELEMDC